MYFIKIKVFFHGVELVSLLLLLVIVDGRVNANSETGRIFLVVSNLTESQLYYHFFLNIIVPV